MDPAVVAPDPGRRAAFEAERVAAADDDLHLTVPGSALWVERLTFRDSLRSDPALVARCAVWKREHVTDDPRGAYDAVETPFVADVLAAHGVDLAPDHVRLLP